jgi:chromosome segregation ATPase
MSTEAVSNNDAADAPAPLMHAIQRLLEERKQLEVYAEETYTKLNQLREEIRTEKAANNPPEQAELERVRNQVQELQTQLEQRGREASQLRVERDTIGDELAQVRQQVEHRNRQSAEFEELIQALVAEVGQREEAAFTQRKQFDEECQRLGDELKAGQEREQELSEHLSKARETANKALQSETEGRDQDEVAAMIEQVEAEIREQQEAIRKEREALQQERAQLEAWRQQHVTSASSESPESPVVDPRFINFTCKHCSGAMQAKKWLAGLVSKCPNCGKMAPVPKLEG